MVAIVIVIFTLLSETINSNDLNLEQCNGDHFSVSCRSRMEMTEMIHKLRREVRSTHQYINENCTVCWYGPCQNGGECVPLSEIEYRCICPPNYKGKNCEILMECKSDSCGENSLCFVDHHMIYCVCKAGYAGNPLKSCKAKKMIAGMAGDPHYKTFDGQRYDYMGTCPYYFIVPCNGSFPEPFGSLALKVKNELSFPNAHVSTVSQFELEFRGHTYHVDMMYNLYIDGILVTMPYYYPTARNPQLSFTIVNSYVTIHDESLLTIYFSHGMLYVVMPDDPSLHGPDVMCGLAGNRDYNCTNDFKTRDGYYYTPVNNSCSNRGEYFTEEFGDTYITDDFLNVKVGEYDLEGGEGCLKGVVVANNTEPCDKKNAEKLCAPILDSAGGSGPFGLCKGLGEQLIIDIYHDCIFDVCQRHGLICTIFGVFAKVCQLELPLTSLNWRRSVGCPDIHCPLHSTYTPCASGCPLTCANKELVECCTKPCAEGCECNPGYLLDESISVNPQCVLPSDCGCKDDDGNYHPANTYWLTENCTIINSCEEGVYIKKGINCSENAYCGVDHHFHMRCRCNKGYKGDGFICEDIDECADPQTCNADKNQGVCFNTPGSYYCKCYDYYEGHDCELYRPKRHCADLYLHHGIMENGVYDLILKGKEDNNTVHRPISVFCNMDLEEDGHMGGWTLISSTHNSTIYKTYQEYVDGFGDPAKSDVWLGLENLHILTTQTEMMLRLNLMYCATSRKPEAYTYCTYPLFRVLNGTTQHAVVIPQDCHGNDSTYVDGWVRWTTEVGPSFYAFDNDPSNCSEYFFKTGWWFDHYHRCGVANLNGKRYSCNNPPPVDQLGKYLLWNNNPISTAQMLLRPVGYPHHEQIRTTATPITVRTSEENHNKVTETATTENPFTTDANESWTFNTPRSSIAVTDNEAPVTSV